MRRASLLPVPILLLLAAGTSSAAGLPSATSQWRFGDELDDSGNALVVDGGDHAVSTGSFRMDAYFGGVTLTSAGDSDIYVWKRTAFAGHVWSQRFGGSGADAGYGVAVDGADAVLVTGVFTGTVNFGGADLVSAGGTDIFVVKLDASGSHVWSLRAGGSGDDAGASIDVDVLGNAVVAGHFSDAIDFGGGPLTSLGGTDIVLAKLDPTGAHLWSMQRGGTGDDRAASVAVDPSGDVLFTGAFRDVADFGGAALASAGDEDIVIAKYGSAGNHVWSAGFGSAGTDFGTALDTDAGGNVFATGAFSGMINLGGADLADSGSLDIFLARFDPDGGHAWSIEYAYGGPSNDVAMALSVSPLNDVGITGSINELGGHERLFMARYTAAGTEQWNIDFISTLSDRGNGIAFDSLGGVTITGYFEFLLNFGLATATSAGGRDGFLARYFDDNPVPTDGSGSSEASPIEPLRPTWSAPNPFSASTTITYRIDTPGDVSIEIFDASGARVARIDEGMRAPGVHHVAWSGRDADGRSLSSGVYYYRLAGATPRSVTGAPLRLVR